MLRLADTKDHSDIDNARSRRIIDDGQNDSSVEEAKVHHWVNRNLFAESKLYD